MEAKINENKGRKSVGDYVQLEHKTLGLVKGNLTRIALGDDSYLGKLETKKEPLTPFIEVDENCYMTREFVEKIIIETRRKDIFLRIKH